MKERKKNNTDWLFRRMCVVIWMLVAGSVFRFGVYFSPKVSIRRNTETWSLFCLRELHLKVLNTQENRGNNCERRSRKWSSSKFKRSLGSTDRSRSSSQPRRIRPFKQKSGRIRTSDKFGVIRMFAVCWDWECWTVWMSGCFFIYELFLSSVSLKRSHTKVLTISSQYWRSIDWSDRL